MNRVTRRLVYRSATGCRYELRYSSDVTRCEIPYSLMSGSRSLGSNGREITRLSVLYRTSGVNPAGAMIPTFRGIDAKNPAASAPRVTGGRVKRKFGPPCGARG